MRRVLVAFLLLGSLVAVGAPACGGGGGRPSPSLYGYSR
jgi:hypothetical protein